MFEKCLVAADAHRIGDQHLVVGPGILSDDNFQVVVEVLYIIVLGVDRNVKLLVLLVR